MSRRILVALDTSPGSRAALQRAARLARRLEAELAGVFVQDENLLRLAGLGARELSRGGAPRRALSAEQVERELVRQAARLERELGETARALDLVWSFRTARGRVVQELLAASAEYELLALGMAGLRPGHVRLGSTARRLLAEAGVPLMLIAPGAVPEGAVLALFDGSASSEAALQRARDLLESDETLQVLLLPPSREQAHSLREQAQSLLGAQRADFHVLVGGNGNALTEAVLRLRPATLVLGEPETLDADALARLLGRFNGTVLRVRRSGA